jgi:hypothetical protein
MSGFFFRRRETTTPAPSATADQILLQQLLSAVGHKSATRKQTGNGAKPSVKSSVRSRPRS